MRPFAWYGKRLLCEGQDGRVYLERNNAGWFKRWLYSDLPREDSKGAIIGTGPSP